MYSSTLPRPPRSLTLVRISASPTPSKEGRGVAGIASGSCGARRISRDEWFEKGRDNSLIDGSNGVPRSTSDRHPRRVSDEDTTEERSHTGTGITLQREIVAVAGVGQGSRSVVIGD